MKVSCLPVSIFDVINSGKMDIPEWSRAAKAIGYDGIDISIMFLKNRVPTYISALKAEVEAAGAPIIMMTTYPDFTHPDPVQRERELEYLIADTALCSEIGIKYLRILAGQAHPEMGISEGIGYVVENFKRIAGYGEKYGVGLLYEDHAKPGAWDHVDFSYPPEIFLEICERTKDTSIRLNFDTGNLTAYGVNTMDILPQVIDRVETIHVTDMKELGVFSPVTIGTGVTPNAEVFAYLKQHGFDNWLCIEEASGNGLEGIRIAHDYVRAAWDKA